MGVGRRLMAIAMAILLTDVGVPAAPPSRPRPAELYSMLVLTNAKPGREAEFEDWYANRHVPHVLRVPGIVGAQRYRRLPGLGSRSMGYAYMTLYTIKAPDPAPVIAELLRRSGTPAMPISDALARESYLAVYKSAGSEGEDQRGHMRR